MIAPAWRRLVALAAVPLLVVSCGSADAPATADAGTGGSTWTDLYRDYFGPTGVASCAGNGSCHGSTTADGYTKGNGFLCPSNDAAACYQGLTKPGLTLVHPGDGKPFAQTALYVALRKSSGGGAMPKAPPYAYAFSDADVQRISAWVSAGAKND